MGQVKITHITGDHCVGRNETVGGNSTVRGNAVVKKNLRVEGWLDAPNIKDANKGLFKTAERLREAYPVPQPGWWAMIGTSVPFAVWIVEDGAWVASGGDIAGVTVDNDIYASSVEEISQAALGARETANQAKADAENALNTANAAKTITDGKGLAGGIAPLDANGLVPSQHIPFGKTSTTVYSGDKGKALETSLESLADFVDIVQKDAEGAQAVAGDALEMAQALTDTLAQPGGIATLGQDGKVAAAQLPPACVVVFSEFVEAASVSTGKSEASSTSAAFDVVFDRTGKRFLLRRKINVSGGSGGTGDGTISPDFDLTEPLVGPECTPGLSQYWADWADRDKFTLNAGRVYICEAESALYTFNGTTLVPADRSAAAVAELTQTVTTNKNACDAALAAFTTTTNTLSADVDTATSKANRASLDASNALAAASVATQSINAALEKANDAAKDAADAGRRIDALESATHYEELASEVEWQARKAAGTLSPDKLYYIAEA